MNIARLKTTDADFAARFASLMASEPSGSAQVRESVLEIIQSVRLSGDPAVLDCARRFDNEQARSVAALEVPKEQWQAALEQLPAEQRQALESAAQRLKRYAQQQRGESWDYQDEDGSVLGQRVTALDRVGIYVPGGKASYPSSVLMNAIPARVAGVEEIIMTAPAPAGALNPLVLAAAHVAGVTRVFRLGGAQAIAALAYGTETIPAVDKIVGPGNAYVAAAKREVFGQVGIDMVAGPSEVLILSDGSVPEHWLALDMFAQAEHDELAQSILISPDAAHLDRVAQALETELASQPRREIIRASLLGRGALIQSQDMDEAIALANQVAPEHLELALKDADERVAQVRHAGAIFVGACSPEAIGDYCAGPNHVLPTARTARFASPLGVYDFQKRSSVLRISSAGAQRLGPMAATLARGEGLEAHARSAEIRARSSKMTPAQILAPNLARLEAYKAPVPSNAIKLDAMENPYTLPEELRAAWLQRLGGIAFNRYPDAGALPLKEALEQRYPMPDDWSLLLGNGSDEIIQLLCLAVARPGAVVMAPDPSFVMYKHLALACNLQFCGVPLNPDFGLDLPAFVSAIEQQKPALIFLAQPNNPTGNSFDSTDLRALCEAAPGLLVIDEAYIAFAGADCAQLAAEFEHVLLLRTLSKWGLAGLRLGFLQGPALWLAELEKLRLPYNINVLTQQTVLFALEHGEVFDAQVEILCRERERLAQALAELPDTRVYPSMANFLLVRQSSRQAQHVLNGLRDAGVLIKNLDAGHPALLGCLRPSIGTPEENDELLRVWRDCLSDRL